MPITLNGDTGITTPTYGGTDTSEYLVPVTAFKNRIINGSMAIDQRNAGASVTPAATGYYSCDRYAPQMTQASKFSVQQQTSVVPVGFAYAQKFTQVSTPTVGAGDYFGTEQTIEGFNISDLKWGTANAQTITVSFWVYSSLTGTYCGSIFNNTSSRSYIFTYSIASANTWTYVTATIPGDTSGTYNTNNTEGFRLRFTLTTGSNFQSTAGSWLAGNYATVSGHASWITSSGATFYITGVQLEKGSTATSFDYRPYGQELALCQRYCYLSTGGACGTAQNANNTNLFFSFPVQMRAVPTITAKTVMTVFDVTVGSFTQSGLSAVSNGLTVNGATIGAYSFSGMTAGKYLTVTTGTNLFEAEL
jgi:hypothetical protein